MMLIHALQRPHQFSLRPHYSPMSTQGRVAGSTRASKKRRKQVTQEKQKGRSLVDYSGDLRECLECEEAKRTSVVLREIAGVEWCKELSPERLDVLDNLGLLVCKVLTSRGSEEVVGSAVKVLQRLVHHEPRALDHRGEELERAIVWLIDRPLWEVEFVMIGMKVLLERVSGALGMQLTRFGAVIEVRRGSAAGDGELRVKGLSGEVFLRQVVGKVCNVLSEVGKRCAMVDLELGCLCTGILSVLLRPSEDKATIPKLHAILKKENLLFILLRLMKTAYRLPSPMLLHHCDELLWHYCMVDKGRQKELYLLVFETEIVMEEGGGIETREASMECLFWINALKISNYQSPNMLHALSWIKKYSFLPRLYRFLQRVRCEEDHNWFLICANTFSSAFHLLLDRFANSSETQPELLHQSLQNELLGSGMLDITHSFMKGLINLVHLKFQEGAKKMSHEEFQEAYTIALAVSNMTYFYALCMHGNIRVVQYSEVCGALPLIVETLRASGWIVNAWDSMEIVQIGARVQEECLGLLCLFMSQKLKHKHLDQWPLDVEYIKDETYLRMIDLIGYLSPLGSVVSAQKVALTKRRLELLVHLMHYSTKVISHHFKNDEKAMNQRISKAFGNITSHAKNLTIEKIKGDREVSVTVARDIQDIDGYRALLGNTFHP